MIVRRIAAAIRRQDWFSVAVETLIVVFGVFIGLQVNNWNAARIERVEAAAYLDRIREDLKANQEGATGLIDYYGRVRAHGEAALAAFDQPAERLGPAFLVDLYQTTQISPRPIRRSTYDELLAVGAINAISDLETRQRIANYYANAELTNAVVGAVPVYRERLRSLMPLEAQRAIRAQCPETFRDDAFGASDSFLPEACVLDYPADAAARAVDDILAADGLRADLVRYVSDIDTKLSNWRVLSNRAAALERYLEEKQR